MRAIRRLVHVLLIVIVLLIGAVGAAFVVAETTWFKNRLRAYLVKEANQYLNGDLTIGRLGGNLFSGVELENISIVMDGRQVVSVKDIGVRYSITELISHGASIRTLRLDQPIVHLEAIGDSNRWSISRLIKKQRQEANRSGPGRPIVIEEIGISNGAVIFANQFVAGGVEIPKRVERIDAKIAFRYEPVRFSIDIAHVSFRGSDPSFDLNSLSGGIAVRDDNLYLNKIALRTPQSSVTIDGAVQQYLRKPVLRMQIDSDKLTLSEVGQIVPALANARFQPAFEMKLDGPLDRLGVALDLKSSAGDVSARLVADLAAPGQAVQGKVAMRHLDLEPIFGKPVLKSDLTGDALVDLREAATFSSLDGLRGTVHLDTSRVTAAGFSADALKGKVGVVGRRLELNGAAQSYGASATFLGAVVLPKEQRPVTYDLAGNVQRLNLARLPRSLRAPAAETNIKGAYRVAGTGSHHVEGDIKFADSLVAGARIKPESTASFSVDSTSKGKSDVAYQADLGVSNLDVQRIGKALSLPALNNGRYATSLNGQLRASGRGTSIASTDLTFSGELTESSLMGGKFPQLSFDGNLANDALRVRANGSFANLDPSVASGQARLKGDVGGTVDVDWTMAHLSNGFQPDQIDGAARVSLGPSKIADTTIEHANLDASIHQQVVDVKTLDIAGPDVIVQGSGTVGLSPDAPSNLKLHADSPNLAEMAKLVGKDLQGIAKLDATVTGNRDKLKIAGNLTADGLTYGSQSALTLSTNYTVDLPKLSPKDATVTATSTGTFVTIGGQHINQLTATTTYRNTQLDVEVVASDAPRTMNATGTIYFHPDHQEVHLTRLDLSAQNVQWQLVAPYGAAVQYGSGAIVVKDFHLVSGSQEIDAEGSFGLTGAKPGEPLKVRLTNVKLENMDALLLRPPQFSGVVNATSTIAGTSETPKVDARFEVTQGGFRQFRYEGFNGTVQYDGRGFTIDSRLEQNPTTWVRVNGYAPKSLFATGTTPGGPGATEATEADRVDLHIQSTPIDLALVQGFTTSISNVKGTTQANVDVTGTGARPHVAGTMVITDASLKVEPTGVDYAHINGRFELQDDRMHIVSMTVLDKSNEFMSLTGDVPIGLSLKGNAALQITARNFKVIDNEIGSARLDTDLTLDGDIRAPRIAGEIGIQSGTIKLDPLLAKTGGSPYSTTPTDLKLTSVSASDVTPTGDDAPAMPVFGALKMNVHIRIDDDLIIKSDDLRSENAPIGLGAVNVTIGGDMQTSKEPGQQAVLAGTVTTIRGTYDFQGRRFTILRDGQVRFEGDELSRLNPSLDVAAQRMIQGIQANVNISGRLQRPRIELSSVPPLEQADVLSLIIFNQPVNQLGEGQQISLGQRAEQLALGSVAGELSKSLGNVLNLSEFEIQASPESGATAQLTVGQQVSRNLYVKLEQGVGDVNTTNFILEYEFANWLRLQTNFVQQAATQQALFQAVRDSGFDLIFSFTR